MKLNFIINGAPMASGDLSGGYAPRRKEWLGFALAGASLASSLFGGAKAADQQREAERRLAQEKAKNDAWYNRKYNEHTIDTAAGQNMIRMAKDYARENWRKAAGAAAVGGGTDAAAQMAKDSGNKMVADAVANIEAQDTARKDNIDATYRARSAELSQQQMALDQQKAQNTAAVAGGVSDALMTGAMHTLNNNGKGSPGGGGVDPASNDSWLDKGKDKIFDYIDSEKLKKYSGFSNDYNLLKDVWDNNA